MTPRQRPDRPPNVQDNHDAQVDLRLRRTLEPSTARIAQTIAGAHRRADGQPTRHRPWLTVMATSAAAALIAIAIAITIGIGIGTRPPATPVDRSVEGSETPAITISNLDGPLTVTTPTGGRWVVLEPTARTPQENDP